MPALVPALSPAEFQALLAVFAEFALWAGFVGGFLALAVSWVVRGGAQFILLAMDRRDARKRMADRHFAELHDDTL